MVASSIQFKQLAAAGKTASVGTLPSISGKSGGWPVCPVTMPTTSRRRFAQGPSTVLHRRCICVCAVMSTLQHENAGRSAYVGHELRRLEVQP